MPSPRFIAFGEALTDFIRQEGQDWRAVPGGACWNVARVVARLGVPSASGGAVSQDVFGQQLLAESLAAGLDIRFLQSRPYPPLLAMVPERQPPAYFFIGENSADLHFDVDALPADWEQALAIAHFGGISLARPPLADRLLALAHRLYRAGKPLSFDPNYRTIMAAPDYFPRFEAMAAMARYIKVSDEDLAALYPGLPQDAAMARLRRLAPQASILYTQGAADMCLYEQEARFRQPVFRVAVADTVGCGDAAMGGWLASLLTRPEAEPGAHLRFAAATAACAAMRTGAYAPAADDVAALLRQDAR
ncbi:MAG: carbohydrate kinase [Paludibacterium sp.]|uniref:carbohydrate kinase family protein n=1 Tax=Paludibacterium sp. TaxID=1917523 RepID=UPI0025E45F99|nr:carbohydrate kinase [Paludibacterium sp.]MBV8047813.1 carbohydrate kinase [Paludibacterium sp.]MBV8646088.1 carbohydrate kinase [Paludibacterium sp.]